MFTDVHLKNFAAFSDFRWAEHGQINVVVGENDTGKSHLLKALYTIAKTVEELGAAPRGPKTRSGPHVLLDKLRWTFQPPNLAALIKDGAKALRIEAQLGGRTYTCDQERPAAGPGVRGRTEAVVTTGFNQAPETETSAVFLPPKEVLTIFAAIEISRDKYEIYGFDDTYYDLLKLLRVPPTQGKILSELRTIADRLEAFMGGRITRKGLSDDFLFQRGKRTYAMPQTADGLKKIGLLATLIRNRSLTRGTILFLDEPETNLHPRAISVFTETLFQLAQAGIQIYLATHSYFVLKQLEILARRHAMSVPFCSLVRNGGDIDATFSDMRDGMPDSPIVDESVRLYEEGYNVDTQRPGK